MKSSCPCSLRLSVSTLLLLAFTGLSILQAFDGQLQFSTYYDSNVREVRAIPEPTYGLTLRGRLNHETALPKLYILGEILTQANLDAIFREESKLILNADLDLSYALSRKLYAQGGVSQYRKAFSGGNGSYRWTEGSAFFQYSPGTRYTSWVGYRHRQKTLKATNSYSFSESDLELRGRYDVNSRIFLEGTLTSSSVIHSDFKAVGVVDDTSLVFLDYPQKDQGVDGLLHLRYQGKVIIGAQVGLGNIESNSVIGEYNRRHYRLYLTGNIGPATFYHAVFHRIHKRYQYPGFTSENRYRDPEEPTQNLLHLRLERVLGDIGISYLQISLLENETVFNQLYYNKTLIEFGVKYDL